MEGNGAEYTVFTGNINGNTTRGAGNKEIYEVDVGGVSEKPKTNGNMIHENNLKRMMFF